MTLSCGCLFSGGMLVSEEMLKGHYKHTIEALIFWEQIMRPGRDPLATANLSEAIIKVLRAIEGLYPEASVVS